MSDERRNDLLRRCAACTTPGVDHHGCAGIRTGGWCECPCGTGEIADPLGVSDARGVGPVSDSGREAPTA